MTRRDPSAPSVAYAGRPPLPSLAFCLLGRWLDRFPWHLGFPTSIDLSTLLFQPALRVATRCPGRTHRRCRWRRMQMQAISGRQGASRLSSHARPLGCSIGGQQVRDMERNWCSFFYSCDDAECVADRRGDDDSDAGAADARRSLHAQRRTN